MNEAYEARISKELIRLIHLQALESYPYEVGGSLIGTEEGFVYTIQYIAVTTLYKRRTKGILIADDVGAYWDVEALGLGPTHLQVIGEWHSHPDATAVMSRATDLTRWDRRMGVRSDAEEMEDGNLEWISALVPSKIGCPRYSDRVYIKLGNRIRRVRIVRL